MAKFLLNPNPTFQSKVAFPIAGSEPIDVLLTFKHRTKTALDEFVKTRAEKTDEESFMDMVCGWELTEEYTIGNVSILLENYIGAALATYRKYIDELVQHRAKN